MTGNKDSSGFKSSKFAIQEESAGKGPSDVRIVKLDADAGAPVQEFKMRPLVKEGEDTYEHTRKTYGALAATDADRVAKSRKDARFAINPLLREPLSIEDEERRVIEEKVRSRVGAIENEARAKAAELGYQEGLKRGHDQAFRTFQQESSERTAHLDRLIASFEGAKHDIFRANERYLVELVFRVARMVLLKELSTDKEYVLRIARELIERVGARENIRIRLNPDDLESAAMLRDGLDKAFGALQNVNIEASAQVKRGGCELETEWNVIDASVETQLKGIYEGLIGSKV
jgi:flagellar assembly protein FliH